MQHLMGLVRRCVDDYQMIEAGDRIAVGVSGGKDSLALLALMAGLRQYYPRPFELAAITIDMGMGMDFGPVEAYCKALGVPYTCVKTEIGPIIFDVRKEKNPCSMCAKMRRGALHDAILEKGITKIALGHHYDDAVETFLLSKGIKLATYSSRCIENEILMHLRKISNQKTELSFDEPLNTDWDGNELLLSDVLGTDGDIVMRPIEAEVDQQLLHQCVSRLEERERQIITMRYGLDGKPERTQKEVAETMGISQSYISRLEKRIIARLKKEMLKLLGT